MRGRSARRLYFSNCLKQKGSEGHIISDAIIGYDREPALFSHGKKIHLSKKNLGSIISGAFSNLNMPNLKISQMMVARFLIALYGGDKNKLNFVPLSPIENVASRK